MAASEELVEKIKEIFVNADRKSTGRISRADLSSVFRQFDEWSEEDLSDLFDAQDTSQDGFMLYSQFIEWVMADQAAPEAGEEDDDPASDGEDDDALLASADLADARLDLSQPITLQEWAIIARHLDVDEVEAMHEYEALAAALGESAKDGVPLRAFLDSLNIDPANREDVSHLARAIREAKGEQHTAGDYLPPPEVEAGDQKTLMQAVDQIVRVLSPSGLDAADRPAEDTWAVIAEDKVPFSRAGRAAIKVFEGTRKDELVQLVKAAMASPPMLSSTAGQVANRERCTERVEAIIRECKEAGTKFTDSEWDVMKTPESVLYVDQQGPGFDCTVGAPAAWKRLTEIISKPMLFKNGTKAGDIVQGQIGTCFLLGAMGAVAGNGESAIDKVFIRYDVDLGVYGIRFCLNGEWTHTIIDDYMPVDSSGRLLYAKSRDPEEVWCPLLEKAYCKHHSCYEMCDGGRPNEAIFSLFGGEGGKLVIQDKHKESPATYFKVLKNARERGWLLTTRFVKTKSSKTQQGKCGEAVLSTGLVGGHIYSVLKLVEAHGNKLVCCRNPWGTGEWIGKWADENRDGEWTAEMKEATGFTDEDDGTFWMSIEDFVESSGGVEYARTFGPGWKKLTQYQQFKKGSTKATALWDYQARSDDEITIAKSDQIEVIKMAPGWWTGLVVGSQQKGLFPANYVKLNDRPVARFDLVGTPAATAEGPMNVVVMLMQPNSRMARKFYRRKRDGLNYKDISYGAMQLIVVGPDGKVAMKQKGMRRCLSGELQLPGGGLWKIYALSVDGKGGLFSVRLYVKGGTATLTEVSGASIQEVPL